jgi:hypothetical protein
MDRYSAKVSEFSGKQARTAGYISAGTAILAGSANIGAYKAGLSGGTALKVGTTPGGTPMTGGFGNYTGSFA